MKQKSLSRWLEIIILGCAVCGLVILGVVIPIIGKDIVSANQEFSGLYYPWLIFIWISAVPCYIVLILGWNIAASIGKDCSFCLDNAKRLKISALLAAGDCVFVFVMNVLYLLLDMNHPSVMFGSLFIIFAGIVISVVCAALSHLVKKAADLQEQSELTI